MQEAIELAASAPAKRSRSGGSVSVGSTGALEDWARTSTTESGLPRAGPGVQTARGAGTTDSSGPAIEEDRGFQIARRQVPEKTSPVLERAFDAFNNGALAVADAAYISVLEQEPNNRDALLGLAAVSVRKGKRDAAANIYLKLLSLNPKDSVAQAGLIGLQRGLDPVVAESRIKLLMDKEPNAGHLHFSLGNLYATQARWGEAQGAYFSAYRVDSENPDYAYNLAVSLDHLAQRDAALSYYRRALALANGQPVGFRATAVRNRIRAITGSTTTP